jgi:hypothetical protein
MGRRNLAGRGLVPLAGLRLPVPDAGCCAADGGLPPAPGTAGHLRSPRAWLRAAPEPGHR